MTRDGFDFLVYYLSDYDFASHAHGPAGAMDVALERVDASIGALLEAAGGPDEFLDRYAVIVMSDHGQRKSSGLPGSSRGSRISKRQVVVTASNRAGQVYLLPGAKVDAADLARRLDGEPAVELTLRREGDEAIARRGGEDFPADELEHPDAAERVRAALANPNAGELLVSAAEGWEFADLGGRHHAAEEVTGRSSHETRSSRCSRSASLGPRRASPRSCLPSCGHFGSVGPRSIERLRSRRSGSAPALSRHSARRATGGSSRSSASSARSAT